MEALSSVEMIVENCFETINMCLLWISLIMVTLCADCYCGTLCLWQPFYAEGIVHPTGQLFMAVHLIGYGSVPILRSVFYLSLNSLNPWEAPGWQVITIDADVKQVITSWLQTLDNSFFTVVSLWGKCRDGSGDYFEVWCVPSASCIDQSHNNILTWEWLLPYFLKVSCIYIAVWAVEFINTGCSEWWGFCVICW